MKVYWDFHFEDVLFRTSGELSFDEAPCFVAASTILQPEEMKVAGKMLGTGPFITQVVGVDGKKYSLFNCRITEVGHRMGPSLVIELRIPFSMIVQENEVNTKYIGCSFTFDQIEELFPLQPFESELSQETKVLLYRKPDSTIQYCPVGDDLQFKVESQFEGAIRGNKIYDLNIVQTKRIFLRFSEQYDIDHVISRIVIIKQYFEMICSQELHVKDIFLEGNSFQENGNLVYSDFNIIYNPRANHSKLRYHGTYDEIIGGLKGWISNYDQMKPGILIWLKQFYNSYVGQSDIILWNCQTIEFLGACTECIKAEAKKSISGHHKDPNIKAYLQAINVLYHFWVNIDDSYYYDAKLVRDKITHNNPEKTVSSRQLRNTEELVKNWSKRLILVLIGLEKVPSSMCLIPANVTD